MKKVLVTTSSFGKYDQKPIRMLEEADLEVELNPFGRKLTEKEVKDLLVDKDYLIAGTEPLTRHVLSSFKELKIISRCGTGMDNVDLAAADELGIQVVNTPDAPSQAVAELTVAMILSLLRRIPVATNEVHSGIWNKRMGNLIYGKAVGIIGLGRIGTKVAKMLSSLDANVSYYDVKRTTEDYPYRDFNGLLKESDIISLHLSGAKDNVPVLGCKDIAIMKEGAFVINTSRGGLIDEKALAEAIKGGHIAGAAIDVFEKEPYSGILAGIQEVILTPHVGSYAREARIMMEVECVENLLERVKNL